MNLAFPLDCKGMYLLELGVPFVNSFKCHLKSYKICVATLDGHINGQNSNSKHVTASETL